MTRLTTKGNFHKRISKIYSYYNVPSNLQNHLRRVAAIGELICDNWNGPPIDKKRILDILLIHDIGNIVKLDLETPNGIAVSLVGNDKKRLTHFKKVRDVTIKKYGNDDHLVSEKIAKELGMSKREQTILKKKVFNNNEETAKSNDWEIKICAYADQRVGPFGILSLKKRFSDLKKRYARRENKNVNNPKLNIFIACAYEIEKQIFSHTKIRKEDVFDESVKKYMNNY